MLRGQPFFGTRRQQLSYRVMLVQGFIVAVLFGATVGVDLFYVVGHLLRQQAVPGASTGFTVVSVFVASLCLSVPRCFVSILFCPFFTLGLWYSYRVRPRGLRVNYSLRDPWHQHPRCVHIT